MYEDKTYANVLKATLARVPEDVSKRPGDVVYDMLSTIDWDISELYFALRFVIEMVFLSTARGKALDHWGWQTGLPRNPAMASVYKFTYTGTRPEPGTRFFAEKQYFTLIETEEGELVLESEGTGKATATIIPGAQAVPMENIKGLTAAYVGDIITPGVDTEDDEHYRERIHEKLAGPAENGNALHYKAWCESIAGVGRAKVIPLFAGENTVMAVLFDPDGRPVVDAVCEEVQEYIDPITRGCTVEYGDNPEFPVGDGIGSGKANIGAHFAAVAAEGIDIDVSGNVTLAEGFTIEAARKQAEAAITAYFRETALGGMDSDGTAIKLSAIGAAILECDAIDDYTDLLLNSQARNIRIGSMAAPILREVELNAAV